MEYFRSKSLFSPLDVQNRTPYRTRKELPNPTYSSRDGTATGGLRSPYQTRQSTSTGTPSLRSKVGRESGESSHVDAQYSSVGKQQDRWKLVKTFVPSDNKGSYQFRSLGRRGKSGTTLPDVDSSVPSRPSETLFDVFWSPAWNKREKSPAHPRRGEKSPVLSKRREKSPAATLVRREKSPSLPRKQDKSPPLHRRREKSPPLSVGSKRNEKSPVATSDRREKSPSLPRKQDKSPPLYRRREKSPPVSVKHEKSPVLSRNREKSPSVSRHRDKLPYITRTREKSPALHRREISPVHMEGDVNSRCTSRTDRDRNLASVTDPPGSERSRTQSVKVRTTNQMVKDSKTLQDDNKEKETNSRKNEIQVHRPVYISKKDAENRSIKERRENVPSRYRRASENRESNSEAEWRRAKSCYAKKKDHVVVLYKRSASDCPIRQRQGFRDPSLSPTSYPSVVYSSHQREPQTQTLPRHLVQKDRGCPVTWEPETEGISQHDMVTHRYKEPDDNKVIYSLTCRMLLYTL